MLIMKSKHTEIFRYFSERCCS